MADDRISEDRAAAALERAAQLQLEAAERVERAKEHKAEADAMAEYINGG